MEVKEESNNLEPNFYQLIYNPNDKSVIGAYMIVNDFDKMIEVLNLTEVLSDASVFIDGTDSYFITINYVKLPKSQITVIGPVDDMDGFFYIKIPYWLYKKSSKELDVKRIPGRKRLSITSNQRYNGFFNQINNPNVEKYFNTIDTDVVSRRRFTMYQKQVNK